MSNSSEEEHHLRFARMGVLGKGGGDAGNPTAVKKKRNPPGNPDPNAEVVALSPRTLLATNRYICEVCHKGFQRDQNLQLHRRGHNLPWKLKQRTTAEVKKRVYVCPEMSCAHHDPNRALGDLTGIKKHYSRKHGEKKWKCDKCLKRYAVQSDWKAHAKICGTKEYRCDCGTIFSRKDSFVTHRAFCDALNEENYRTNHGLAAMVGNLHSQHHDMVSHSMPSLNSSTMDSRMSVSGSDPSKNKSISPLMQANNSNTLFDNGKTSSISMSMGSSFMSATALLQKAAEMGAKFSDESISPILIRNFAGFGSSAKPETAANSYSYSEVSSEAGNGRLLPPVSYAGAMTSKRGGGGDASRFAAAADHDPFSFGKREAGEDSAERRNGRMTQDFLGLGASGSKSVGSNGNLSCNEDEMYSYHQMPNGAGSWEKHVWDF